MNIHTTIEWINKTYGTGISSGYYRQIEAWRQWWAGHVKSFHRYREVDENGVGRERELYSLRMAKKVCEDWASILLTEKTRITLGDRASSDFLQGEDGCGGVLRQIGFWNEANALLEKAFYSGTGAFVMKLDGLSVDEDGTVLKSPNGSIRMEYLPAMCLVPLSHQYGQITEAAFVSQAAQRGKKQVYIELHLKENGRYIIENRCFEERQGRLLECALPPGVAPRIDTGSPLPFFAVVRPNVVNPYDGTIRIDTAIDSSGFEHGLTQLEQLAGQAMAELAMAVGGGALAFEQLGAQAAAAGTDAVAGFAGQVGAASGEMAQPALQLMAQLAEGLERERPALTPAAEGAVQAVADSIAGAMDTVTNAGGDIVRGLWEGVKAMGGWLAGNLAGFIGGAVQSVKDFLGIASPSALFRDEIGKMMPAGISLGFAAAMPAATEDIEQQMGRFVRQAQASVWAAQHGMAQPQTGMGAAGGVAAPGNTYYYNQEVHTHEALSPYELTQEFMNMKAREGWDIP
ncbi:MAG: hypothetical protein AB7V55_01935 [Oscillospiraceae bacterium]